MCKPILDRRTNYLLLKAVNSSFLEDETNHRRDAQISSEYASRESRLAQDTSDSIAAKDTRWTQRGLILKIVACGILVIMCAFNHIESNAMRDEAEKLRVDINTFNHKNAEKRRSRTRNAKANREAYQHVLKSYDVSEGSDLADQIQNAYTHEQL